MSGAGRSTGPQHAQSLESWLAHVPGLKVVWPVEPRRHEGLLKSAIRDPNPVVFDREPRAVTRATSCPTASTSCRSARPRRARRRRRHVVAWGAAVRRALAAAEQLAGEASPPRCSTCARSAPWTRTPILESVARTGRLVVVHEAVGPFGAGAEIAALVAERGFDTLRAPIRRVAAPFAPVPFPPDLEAAYFPQADRIAGVARELVGA